jgi:hypothetical protein
MGADDLRGSRRHSLLSLNRRCVVHREMGEGSGTILKTLASHNAKSRAAFSRQICTRACCGVDGFHA